MDGGDDFAPRHVGIGGRTARYVDVGRGVPVVLVHGWALGHRSFRPAMERLVGLGFRVLAPSLPGFGGTSSLPHAQADLAGYAGWLATFLGAVGTDEPVVLVGHSFGGGVATQTAHDHPELVRALVLVNSVGGGTWKGSGSRVEPFFRERPLWHWAVAFPNELLSLPAVVRFLPRVVGDAVPSFLRDPVAAIRVADLTRHIDLADELARLAKRDMPVVVIWGSRDRIVPRASYEALCRTLGVDGIEVDGGHAWLIADPAAFADAVAEAAHLDVKVSPADGGQPPVRRLGDG